MNVKIAVLFFAVATLFQLSHCIPTHRYARDTPDWTSRIKEYFNKIPGYGSSESQTTPPSTNQPESSSYQQGTAAASELHSLITTKEGNTPSSSVPSFGSYMPNMQNYQNMVPSGMSSYYPSQMPQSMNPSSYLSSMQGSSSAAGTTGSASAPEAAIAAKEGNTQSSSVPSFGSYMPNMQNYQNMVPSGMSSYYPSQMPQSMNPSSYLSSMQGGSSAAGTTGSASAPEAAIAAKEGNTQSSSTPSFGSYMPNMQSYQNMIPSGMGSYYPSQMPQSMNPSSYLSSMQGGSSAVGTAGSASEPEAAIAAKEGNTQSSSTPSFGSYMPNMQNYQNMVPSGMSSYYPSQMPQSMNPSSYLNSKPTGS